MSEWESCSAPEVLTVLVRRGAAQLGAGCGALLAAALDAAGRLRALPDAAGTEHSCPPRRVLDGIAVTSLCSPGMTRILPLEHA